MNYRVAYHTDVGIKKKTNQDGLLIKGAETEWGDVLFAAVCDGMGGLSKGELASSQVLRAFADYGARNGLSLGTTATVEFMNWI